MGCKEEAKDYFFEPSLVLPESKYDAAEYVKMFLK